MLYSAYIAVGIIAGALSGLFGIGGGIVIIPALLYLFKFTQHQAQGTTLALMVPPIGIVAAWMYYRKGLVDPVVAGLICVGFVLGSYIGARAALTMEATVLKKIFGVVMLIISLKMIIEK